MEYKTAGEFDAWVAQNVPAARHAQLRDAADSLADLRCCDIDDLDDALELLQWPEPERRRFLEAWRALCEASVPSGDAIDPAAIDPAPSGAAAVVDPRTQGAPPRDVVSKTCNYTTDTSREAESSVAASRLPQSHSPITLLARSRCDA